MQPSASTIGLTLIDELARQGVTDIVISPGSRSAPLALAAAGHEGIRIHVRVDERTAAFLALGLARGSGHAAAVLCSSGTATAGFLPAVLEADSAGVALLVLTADRPAELHDIGANQTMHQDGLYGRATRWSHRVDTGGADPGGYLRSVAARAVAEATGLRGVPGPVHLNVPLREPLLDVDGEALGGVGASYSVGPGSSLEPADALGQLQWASTRGLVVAGEGAASTEPAAAALAAAQELGWPVIAEPTSGLRTGAPALRCGHWLASSAGFVAAHVPEVVVLLGRPVLSRATSALVQTAADAGAQVVVCDPAGRGFDPSRTATRVLACSFAVAAAAQEPGALVTGWLEEWLEADRRAGSVLDEQLDGLGDGELAATREVVSAMPDGSTLVVASSLAIRHLNETMPQRAGLRVVGNRGLSGIDGFTSTALGVALGSDGPVAALAGDLSMLHDLTGLVIGSDEPMVSLPIVVLANNGGGIFDLLPYGSVVDPETFRRVFATPHGIPLEALAITMSCGHTTADDVTELGPAIHDAWSTPGITLIEVLTNTPTETARHRAVQQAILGTIGA